LALRAATHISVAKNNFFIVVKILKLFIECLEK
jgi:hypothetical protein